MLFERLAVREPVPVPVPCDVEEVEEALEAVDEAE